MNSVIAALIRGGAKDVSTNSLSLSARYDQAKSSIIGFDAANYAQGSVRLEQVGRLIDGAVAAGATSVNGPLFSSTQDQESLYRAALGKAVAQARARAAAMASAAGVTLGSIISVESGYGSAAVAAPAAASASTPVLAPTQEITASVTAVFAVS